MQSLQQQIKNEDLIEVEVPDEDDIDWKMNVIRVCNTPNSSDLCRGVEE